MGLAMYLQTCQRIARNPGVSTVPALLKHTFWHVTRRLHSLPLRVPMTRRSHLEISRRQEINGSVALAWSQRLYDYNNMSLLMQLTQRPAFCRVYFDVGANIGPYSLILSESDQAEVHAFEPHPGTFQTLQRCMQANQRHQVQCHNLALSDADGKLRFTDSDCDTTNHVVNDGASDKQTVEVTAMSGTAFCARHSLKPDVIKIDTEGHEAEVLRGFGALLHEVKVVILEENQPEELLRECLPDHLFEGPLYVDHQARLLRRQKIAPEDAVYVNKAAIAGLTECGYGIEPVSSLPHS